MIAIIQASGRKCGLRLPKTLRKCWSIIIPILLSVVGLAMVLSTQCSTGGAKMIAKSGKILDFCMGKFTKLDHYFGARSWNKNRATMTQLKSWAPWLLMVRGQRPQRVALWRSYVSLGAVLVSYAIANCPIWSRSHGFQACVSTSTTHRFSVWLRAPGSAWTSPGPWLRCSWATVGVSLSCWTTQHWPELPESRCLQMTPLDGRIVFICHVAMGPDEAPCAWSCQTAPHHDAPATTLSCGNCVLRLWGDCAQQFQSSLIRTQGRLPNPTSLIKGLLLALEAHHDEEPLNRLPRDINSQRVQISNSHLGRIPGCPT